MGTTKKKPTSRSSGKEILSRAERDAISAPLKEHDAGADVVLGVDRESEMVRRMGPLAVEEFHAIVETCNKHGVSSVDFRGLKLTFQPKVPPVVDAHVFDGREVDLQVAQPPHHTQAEIDQARLRLRELARSGASSMESVEALGEQNVESLENELEMLKITDPVAFEAQMNDAPEYQDAKPS